MARGTNLTRVQDIRGALKRAKAGDLLSLTDCAMIWGISKGAFVNVRNRMATFPDGQEGAKNTILYPAVAALNAMLEHETRADAAEQERQQRAAAILGMNGKRGRRKQEQVYLPPSEMLKLSRLRAEIEERERNMGLYTKTADVRALLAAIFSIQTDCLGHLENKADPNGQWPAALREEVGKAGRACLLQIHRQLSHMLPPDADSGPRRASKPRSKADSPRRKPPVRASVERAKG